MKKTILTSMTAYNVWANKKIIEYLHPLSQEIMDAEIKSSFRSLRKTIDHIWDAQVIWLKRLQGQSLSTWPSAEYKDTLAGAANYFILQSEEFDQYVQAKQELYFSSVIQYAKLSGETFQNTAWQIIMHCMNHSTYHRGQITTMLRALDLKELPSTDYIFYLRERS